MVKLYLKSEMKRVIKIFLKVHGDLLPVTCRMSENPGFGKFTVRRDWFRTM
jgi:hypothetical protein